MSLTLNGQTYAFDQLCQDESLASQPNLSDDEAQIFRFSQQWLTGQQAFSLQTSGSTGTPKTIHLSRTQLSTSARLTGHALGLQPGDRALVCLSTRYIAGLMMLVRGFELGLDLVIIPPSSNPLADFPPDTHFDFTAIVPLQLQTILSEAPTKIDILNRMKAILVGGAPVSLALQKQLQSITAPIYHTYGMTETVSHIALRRLNGPNATDRFSPFEGVDLALDERGCLTITAPVTQGETLHTNDLVDLQPDGSFIWLGRVDNVINSGGVKVQLEKVERAIEAFLVEYQQGQYAGRRFLVGALPDERLGQALVAVVEGAPLTDGATNDWEPSLWDERRTTNDNGVFENTVVAHEQRFETALRTDLSRILSRYEVPRQIFFLESLLETPTGKTDRLANLDRLQTILQSRPV